MARWVLYLSVCLVIFQAPLFAQDWTAVIEPAASHVVRLEMLREGQTEAGVCAGVVLNDDNGVFVTAAHCVDKPQGQGISVTADGRHAEVLKTNTLLDLALMKTQLKNKTAITMADKTPRPGTPIAIIGYAFGDPDVLFQFGYVAQTQNRITKLVLLNSDVIGGDSGGACVDAQGRLVAINSRVFPWYSSGLAGSVPIETLKEFAEQFLPKTK